MAALAERIRLTFIPGHDGIVLPNNGPPTLFLREDGTFAAPGGGPGGGTDEVLLVPAANKTIPVNSSVVVGDYYSLGSGIVLTIASGSNLTVI